MRHTAARRGFTAPSRLAANHLSLRKATPHGAFVRVLRHCVICTINGAESPEMICTFSRLLFSLKYVNMVTTEGQNAHRNTNQMEDTTMNTTYFDEMTATCTAWESAKKERTDRKKQIVDTYGYGSPEMDAWYAEDKAAGSYPYTGGEMKAYWVFKNRRENGTEEFEMNDYCWDREFHDFIETLRKLGITEFTFTNQSTALMENIHGFIAEGCTMIGAHTLTKQSLRWGEEQTEKVPGILFKVN